MVRKFSCDWVNVRLSQVRRLRRMDLLRSVRTSLLNVLDQNMLRIFLMDRIKFALAGKSLVTNKVPLRRGLRHRRHFPVFALVWDYLLFLRVV